MAVEVLPFQCIYCVAPVRGDVPRCPACGAELHINESTKGEQRLADLEAAGRCGCCARPMAECERHPCFGEDSGGPQTALDLVWTPNK